MFENEVALLESEKDSLLKEREGLRMEVAGVNGKLRVLRDRLRKLSR